MEKRANIPLYDEAERIARRIHEKALEETGKIYKRPKSTASRPKR